MGDSTFWHIEADFQHGRAELVAVFRLGNGFPVGADELHAKTVERAALCERQRGIERCLPAHGRQDCVRPFFLDDLLDNFRGNGLHIGGIGKSRIGHDCRRVGVHQNDAVAFLFQRLAGLSAGIVKLAGLADDDGPGADDHDGLDIGTFRHFFYRPYL